MFIIYESFFFCKLFSSVYLFYLVSEQTKCWNVVFRFFFKVLKISVAIHFQVSSPKFLFSSCLFCRFFERFFFINDN